MCRATEGHLGLLKAKLARLRAEQLEEAAAAKGPKGEGFDVKRVGCARVALIGFPSVGKSTLLSKMTGTESEAAAYEFTTLTAIPGNLYINGARIQMLDLPGIIEGAAKGVGRGKQVIAAGRNADMVLMILDAAKAKEQREKLVRELAEVGIRLNRRPPNVSLTLKQSGGVKYSSTVRQPHMPEKVVKNVLKEYKLHNVELVVRDTITVDDLIDTILTKTTKVGPSYLPCLFVHNKIDTMTLEEVEQLAREPHSLVISSSMGLNLDRLRDRIWEYLSLQRVYTRRPGQFPDFADPMIVKQNATVSDVCASIHKSMQTSFRYALVWGKSAKHQPQKCGISHVLEDKDVIQVFATSVI